MFGKLAAPLEIAPQLRLRLEDINADVRAEAVVVVDKLVPAADAVQSVTSGPLKKLIERTVNVDLRDRWKKFNKIAASCAGFTRLLAKKGAENYVTVGQSDALELEMQRMDTDGDGVISREEYVQAGGDMGDFDKFDSDGSGKLDMNEVQAFVEGGTKLESKASLLKRKKIKESPEVRRVIMEMWEVRLSCRQARFDVCFRGVTANMGISSTTPVR